LNANSLSSTRAFSLTLILSSSSSSSSSSSFIIKISKKDPDTKKLIVVTKKILCIQMITLYVSLLKKLVDFITTQAL
jgi:hypothetical protein